MTTTAMKKALELDIPGETFGQRLIRLRTAAGILTGSDLAAKIWGIRTDRKGYKSGKNRDTIWRYESDQGLPDLKNLTRLADALGITVQELDPLMGQRREQRRNSTNAAAPEMTTKTVLELKLGGPIAKLTVLNFPMPEEAALEVWATLKEWERKMEGSAEVSFAEPRGSGAEVMPNVLKRR